MESIKNERRVPTVALSGGIFLRYLTFIVLGISLFVIFFHFALFQIKHPAEIGIVITDIVILAIILVILLQTHHLSKLWRGPFIWINVGILLFFAGFLFELLSEFFIKPTFIQYSIENGLKLIAFGVLAWGFIQWGKEKIEASGKLEKIRKLDNLTSLLDKSAFHRELERFERMAKRYLEYFSLICFSVDDFVEYNEDKGKVAGDNTLQKIARLLSSSVREGDNIFRYSESEFIILTPLVGITQGAKITEKIAKRLKTFVEDGLQSENITVSVVTVFYEEEKNTLERIEEGMQKVKSMGKNSIYLAN